MRVLVSEAWRSAISRRVSAGMGFLLSLVFISAIAGIVARSDAEQRDLQEQLDVGVSRVIEVRAGGVSPILPQTFVEFLPTITGVDYVGSASPARDVVVASTQSGPIPLRVIYGDVPGLIVAPCGEGQLRSVALSYRAADEFHIDSPVGAVEQANGGQLSITNFTSVPVELAGRLDGAMTRCGTYAQATSNGPVVSYVVADSIENVAPIAEALQLLVASVGQDIVVVSSSQLAQYRTSIAGEVNTQRTKGIWLAASSLAILNLVIGAATSILRRSEFGRRRVLGASRSRLGAIVFLEGLIIGGISFAAGAVVILSVHSVSELWIDVTWLPALAVLVGASSILGQLPAVAASAMMDPVRILRVP